ncbi:hypothetical protein OG381_27195 [Streptomyces sp. NBC_00490]|uniref:hypothetical protein n=1 Tax=Streptomyces sp. NBC_00490 TaxID=2903657 RepID=UPI002E192F98
MVDWKTGEGVSGIADPAEVDAAFERGEWPLGTAVIAPAFNCSLEEASPRIVSGCGYGCEYRTSWRRSG